MKDKHIAVPLDTKALADQADGNVYKALMVVAKRANQITTELKEELGRKLVEFAPAYDNLDEVMENKEQIEISRYYERKPKATHTALDEFQRGEVYWRDPNNLDAE